jgi:DNA-nicking Smr family endonuclease
MAIPFAPGQFVHTPLGKGQVLEVRNRRVLVRVQTRAVLLDARDLTAIAGAATSARSASAPRKAPAHDKAPAHEKAPAHKSAPPHEVTADEVRESAPFTLDVHGLTVDQALEAIDAALNDALLRNADELRVVHGRSRGRIRDALHRHVRELSAVRMARLDPANAGVTIIVLA